MSDGRRKPQCRWAISHGGDGFLLCGRDAGHDESVEAHATVYETHGALTPPKPGEDQREWFPEWLWRSVVEQERKQARSLMRTLSMDAKRGQVRVEARGRGK